MSTIRHLINVGAPAGLDLWSPGGQAEADAPGSVSRVTHHLKDVGDLRFPSRSLATVEVRRGVRGWPVGIRLGLFLLFACAGASFPLAASAAPPEIPGQMSYQGVLLDDEGIPLTGNVDLVLRIYDALSSGTLLYKQSFVGVPLEAGVFTLTLGPSGSATDSPTNPLTTSLADALTGDLPGTAPGRFLGVTVGSNEALARTQVLAVPYALRAESAGVAESALDASSVNGVSGDFVTALWEQTNLDNSGPKNNDPREGFADVDGDGTANFVDPDNDDDSLNDGAEGVQGSDINLVTPILSGVTPTSTFSGLTTRVTVNGANFEPGLSVSFGSESPAPIDLDATSFEVDVGPQSPGTVNVQVTRTNGETDTLPSAFRFIGFTAGSFTHEITLLGGTPISVTGALRSVLSGMNNYGVDVNEDGIPETVFSFPSRLSGHIAVAFAPSGTLIGLRCESSGSDDCNVEIRTDTDADFNLADETGIILEALTVASNARITFPGLAFDPSGRAVAAYARANTGGVAVVAHDRDGDGLFAGPNERVDVAVATVPNNARLDVAVDGAGRVGIASLDDGVTNRIRVAWDRSGDGDFADTVDGKPEITTVATVPATLACLGLGFAPDGDPAVVWDTGTSGPSFARDLNGDGDFTDTGEVVLLSGSPSTACDAHGGGGFPLAVAHNAGGTLVLLTDRTDDGDFADLDESLVLESAAATRLAVARNPAGVSFVASASPNRIYATHVRP